MLKQNGEWEVVDGIEVIRLDLDDMLSTSSEWVFHNTRGWYRNVYAWRTTQNSNLNVSLLNKVRRVSAVFTSYYDDPVGGLGDNQVWINLSDGTVRRIGTRDNYTDGTRGQIVERGTAESSESGVTRNILEERITYDIPESLFVTGIEFASSGYVSDSGYQYPFSYRGMKDFEFTLRH